MLRIMSSVKHILLVGFLLIGVASCRKDIDEFRPYVYGPSQASLTQLLGQVPLAGSATTFTLQNLNHDTTLTTPSGLRLSLTDPEMLFANANNQPVATSTCPNLQVEVIEALDRRGLVGRRLHTATYPDGQLLETGGAVHIRVTCEGTPLQLLTDRTLKVQIPAATPVNTMQAFDGILSNNVNFLGWQATGEPVYLAEWISHSELVKGYEVYPALLGWVGVGRALPEATSNFCIELPTAMTDQTAQVAVVFKGPVVVAAPQYDPVAKTFCFAAPEGYPVRVVAFSKLGTQYWLGHRETEIGTNTMLQVEPQKTDEAALLEFLQNL